MMKKELFFVYLLIQIFRNWIDADSIRVGRFNVSHPEAHQFLDKTSFAHFIHLRHRLNVDDEICSKEKVESWEEELEQFVHHSSSKTLLYIFYHDAPSRERALKLSSCHDWMFPIRLKISPYAESQAYRDVFYYLQKYWIDHNITYIITTSYKILENNDLTREMVTDVTLKDFGRYLNYIHSNQYDVVPLVRTNFPLMLQAIVSHGGLFGVAWDALLQGMGYNSKQIRSGDKFHIFSKNSLIARTTVFRQLTNFMSFALNTIETNSTVEAALSANANYPGKMTKEQLQIAFHAPYYKMFPFILERLPVFFLYHMQYKICDDHQPQCPKNLKIKDP